MCSPSTFRVRPVYCVVVFPLSSVHRVHQMYCIVTQQTVRPASMTCPKQTECPLRPDVVRSEGRSASSFSPITALGIGSSRCCCDSRVKRFPKELQSVRGRRPVTCAARSALQRRAGFPPVSSRLSDVRKLKQIGRNARLS